MDDVDELEEEVESVLSLGDELQQTARLKTPLCQT